MRRGGTEERAFKDGYDNCRVVERRGGQRGDSELRESSQKRGLRPRAVSRAANEHRTCRQFEASKREEMKRVQYGSRVQDWNRAFSSWRGWTAAASTYEAQRAIKNLNLILKLYNRQMCNNSIFLRCYVEQTLPIRSCCHVQTFPHKHPRTSLSVRRSRDHNCYYIHPIANWGVCSI